MHVRQPILTSLKFERQLGVFNAQQPQDRRVQVVYVYWINDWVVADFVRFADGDAAFDAAAREPHGEGAWVVIAAQQFGAAAGFVHRGAPEFAAPDDKGF